MRVILRVLRCLLRRVARVGEVCNVVHETRERRWAVPLRAAAERKAIESLVGAQITKHRLYRRELSSLHPASRRCVNARACVRAVCTPTFVLLDAQGHDVGCIVELPSELRERGHAVRPPVSRDALHAGIRAFLRAQPRGGHHHGVAVAVGSGEGRYTALRTRTLTAKTSRIMSSDVCRNG